MSDWIVFWHRNNERPIFTDSDWTKYWDERKMRIAELSKRAVYRFLGRK